MARDHTGTGEGAIGRFFCVREMEHWGGIVHMFCYDICSLIMAISQHYHVPSCIFHDISGYFMHHDCFSRWSCQIDRFSNNWGSWKLLVKLLLPSNQVGSDNIQLLWSVPANGGSPILGYHVDMEAAAWTLEMEMLWAFGWYSCDTKWSFENLEMVSRCFFKMVFLSSR